MRNCYVTQLATESKVSVRAMNAYSSDFLFLLLPSKPDALEQARKSYAGSLGGNPPG